LAELFTSELVEDALYDIRTIHRDYKTVLAAAEARSTGRGRMGIEGTGAARSTQLAIASLAATVEHYSRNVLTEDASVSPNTWHKQQTAWQERLGIDLKRQCPHYPALRGFVDARNAILHGGGTLTKQQTENVAFWPEIQRHLAAAGINRVRHTLVFTPELVERCAEVCVAVVVEMESCRARALPSLSQTCGSEDDASDPVSNAEPLTIPDAADPTEI
jgi:hypothetical protein